MERQAVIAAPRRRRALWALVALSLVLAAGSSGASVVLYHRDENLQTRQNAFARRADLTSLQDGLTQDEKDIAAAISKLQGDVAALQILSQPAGLNTVDLDNRIGVLEREVFSITQCLQGMRSGGSSASCP